MPSATEVPPGEWSNTLVLYDDGEYSITSGVFRGRSHLGERWNGDTESPLGFPNVFGHSIWHVVPEFLEIPVLHGVLNKLARNPQAGRADAVMQVLGQHYPQTP